MTLIEVLVAMAIFGAVAVPLFAMFSNSMKMERRALVESISTYTAQMKIEEAYGTITKDEADEGVMENGTETIILSYDSSGDPDDAIELFYELSAELDESGYDLIKVTVTVGSEFFEVETTLESLIRPSDV